jgi:hypothetical protein
VSPSDQTSRLLKIYAGFIVIMAIIGAFLVEW